MAHVFAEHLAALTDRQLWLDNPLAIRDARREFRRNRVFNAILALCIALLVIGVVGASILSLLLTYIHHVPDWLGGHFGTALAILVSGIHFWWVARAAQSRVDGMLMREAALDGMTSLLMLPMSRLSLVLHAAVYPWMSAIWVSVLLLPVYVFCVGIDGMRWDELLALYTLFALTGVAMPAFRRPALSGNVAATMLNQATDDTTGEAETGRSFLRKRGARAGFSAVTTIGVIPLFFVLLAMMAGFGGLPFAALSRYVPESILSLVPSCIISLPFMAARAMVTPFPFFQWSADPLPFVVFLVLGYKYIGLVRTSEFLSVGQYRNLVMVPSYRPRRSAELAHKLLTVVIAAGYLWTWAIRDNGIGFLALHPSATDSGAQGLLFLALFVAGAWGVVRAGLVGLWMNVFSAPKETRRTVTWRSALAYCLSPFLYLLGITLICLLVGGDLSEVAGAVPMAGQIIAIELAAMVLNFGLRRLTGSYGVVGCLITAMPIVWFGNSRVRFLVLLSPTLGAIGQGPRHLLGLSDPGGPLSGARPYTQWIAAEAGLGLVLCLMGWLVSLAIRRRRPADDAERLDEDEFDLVYDPTTLGKEVFADTQQQRRDALSQSDSALSISIVQAIERCVDNAIVTRDLRARLRSRVSGPKFVTIFMVTISLCAAIGAWMPALFLPGSGFSELMYGSTVTGSLLQKMANLQGCFYIALPIAAFLCGYAVLPRAFGLDKRKNTLLFLLTTPMSTWAIVSGKAFALLFTGGAAIWFCAILSFALCVPISAMTGSVVAFAWWVAVFGSTLVAYAATGTVMLALGSLFPDLTSLRLNGCVRLLVLYFVYMALSLVVGVLGILASIYHVSGSVMWASLAGLGCAVIAISMMITVGAITGMRKGDIDIKMQTNRK